VIGWCGFHTWYTDHHRAEIGYGIYKDEFKKQGFMTEALEAVLEYGFENFYLALFSSLQVFQSSPINIGIWRISRSLG